MRISDLMPREDFGAVFALTLSRYWSERFDDAYDVRWDDRGSSHGRQLWQGNKYLNMFFAADAAAGAFANVVREYGAARDWWKRPLQYSYATMAVSRPLRPSMSHFAFTAAPAVPASNDTLVMGGNRRIRLVHPAERQTVVILKDGYDPACISNDMNLRTSLPLSFAPRITAASPNGTWYAEEFVAGTPINRLSREHETRCQREARALLLRELIQPTLKRVPAGDYADALNERLRKLARATGIPEEAGKRAERIARQLREHLTALHGNSEEIPVSMTHGDFQSANILRPIATDTPVVIDWESVSERHAAYDLLVLTLETRRHAPWAQRIEPWIRGTAAAPGDWPGCASQGERTVSITVFLMEEAVTVLTDAHRPRAIAVSPSLSFQLSQLEQATAAVRQCR